MSDIGAASRTSIGALLSQYWRALRYLLIGGGTSLLALLALAGLFVVTVLCAVFGIGLPAVPEAAALVRKLAALERRRAARELGIDIPEPYEPVTGSLREQLRTLWHDPATRRDLLWLLVHAPTGIFIAAVAIGLPTGALNQLLIPAYWHLVPGGVAGPFGYQVTSWPLAWLSVPTALLYGALALLVPAAARRQAQFARSLLRPADGVSLSYRVAELTASRAAALDAHGAELRRIERDLHDGTQARIAAVIMQLGIAEQLRDRDPDAAFGLVRKAQDTAMSALAELRDVVRSIYPPVLSDRGLDGAITALAARCPIPCVLDLGQVGRRPAAVEAAAYFIIAEALTNATKHSGAERVSVGLDAAEDRLLIRVDDDGRGGADETRGSGLAGIRRRVDAFDGSTELTSPVGGPTVLRVELPCGS
ncbi:sensor histidine kinase [Actinokineospora sp. NBRC 105648]|uniref:sensor histidine kinase n=1 Tax=Actinokineospora sp. NBRC 105648 TaxID=3032206 RepID=UPI0024A2FB22|nr:sensor histidine kinase [Actinokineospora sp. NBRC 105648]GLZ43474.1 histidine kinase [Actinokineospora sp. NBRC 105648]